jgi:hypothetical protein
MNDNEVKVEGEADLKVGDCFVYLYEDTRPHRTGQPIYVGVSRAKFAGIARRTRSHWLLCAKHPNPLFARVLERIKRENRTPKMKIVGVFSTWEEALAEEIRLVALYGRRRRDSGTLCNMTDGGQGVLGREMSEAARKHIGERQKALWADPAWRGKILAAWTEEKRAQAAAESNKRFADPEQRKKVSAGVLSDPRHVEGATKRIKALMADPAFMANRNAKIREAFARDDTRANLSAAGKKFWNSAEGKALKSEMMTEAWKNPEYRERMTAERAGRWLDARFREKASAAMKVGIAEMSASDKLALAAKRANAARARWADPEWREHTVAAMTGPDEPTVEAPRGHRSRLNWQNPEYRAKVTASRDATLATPEEFARRSAATAVGWQNESTRSKRAAGIKAAKNRPAAKAEVARKAKAYYADPAKRAEAGAFASAYNTPEVKAAKAAALKAKWQDPVWREALLAKRAARLAAKQAAQEPRLAPVPSDLPIINAPAAALAMWAAQ